MVRTSQHPPHVVRNHVSCFLHDVQANIVLCELVGVLEDAYDYSRRDIATVLDRILHTAQFCFDHKDQLWLTLHDYHAGPADFSDYLIGRLGTQAGCTETLTFDTSLKNSPHFRLL